jgi:acyl-coenzyme A thioesterase PaaI-like protein
MHGGVIASLVHLAGTLATLSLIGPSRSMVTTDMNISYIAAAPADVNLLAIVYFVDLLCIFGFPVAP